MSRLVRRLFAHDSTSLRPARRNGSLRTRLWLESLERRIAPATFTVLNTNDAGAGSLRQAILSANSASGTDTVVFNTDPVAGTDFRTPQNIFLTSGQITISGSTTLTGQGASLLTVNGNNSSRVFNISGTGVLAVTMTGLTITGGRIDAAVTTKSGDGAGIGIANESVVLDSVVVSGNRITTTSDDSGAGIGVASGGLLTVRNSSITGNQTNALGGGLYFYNGGALLLENSTVSGNSAGGPRSIYGGGGGGGLYFYGTPISSGALTGLTVRNSTISGNTAGSGAGGGISSHLEGGTLVVQNSTITNNSAGDTDTSAGAGGGGIALTVGVGTLTLQSTIVSGNSAANGSADVATGTAVTALYSAVGNSSGFTLSPASAFNVAFGADLKLDPAGLKNNGGPTSTILLLSGSAAIDHGANPASLATDQRGAGFARVDFLTDIGAAEVVSPQLPIAGLSATPNVTTNGGTTYSFQVVYSDAAAINVATLDNADIRVTGPNSFNQLATFVSVAPTGNGSPRTATYRITPPGGSWDGTDFGAYTIALEPNQVANTSGATVAASPLGSFQVNTPATFTVTNANDTGPGSLRAAIALANAHTGTADTIVFDANSFSAPPSIGLTSGELLITDPLTITGLGSGVLTVRRVSGSPSFRIFEVNGPGVMNVTLSGMTVTGGSTTGTAGAGTSGDGGGILLANENLTLIDVALINNFSTTEGGGIGVAGGAGSLTLQNCTLSGNVANGASTSSFSGAGGGIYVAYGTDLTVQNSTISGNSSANGNAGGIYFYSSGAGGLTIVNSTISNNSAAGGSAGIRFNSSGENLSVTSSTISGNTAGSKGGGGVYFLGIGGGALTVRNSTISGNTATSGAGLNFYATGDSLLVENSTISGNTATTGVGGGIYYFASGGGGMTVRNSTISSNSAANSGGGIALASGDSLLVQNSTITGNSAGLAGGGIAEPLAASSPVTVVSSIVSGNSDGGSGPDILSGGTVNVTFSAIGSAIGFTLSPASGNNLPFGADLKLQSLGNNGGSNQTIALGSGSPAIDAGANLASLSTDQRGTGFARVSGAAADIGAFEVQVATAPTVTTVGANNGAAQRSMVTSLQVTFSSIVTIAAGAFTLTYSGAPAGGTGGTVGSTVGGFTVLTSTASGVTVATLSAFTGTDTSGGSLIDGRYSLTVDRTKVTADGLAMTNDFTFADSGSTAGNQLYRLYGDATGDRVVNGADVALFVQQFGGPNPTFDFNADGVFNGADLPEFVKRFGLGL